MKNQMQDKAKILLIEICNYDNHPLGGHLTFAKNLLRSFGNDLLLVGCTSDDTPVGEWVKKEIRGVEYDFFSVKKIKKVSFKKTLIPIRIKDFLAVYKHRKKIFSKEIKNIIIQTPEVLFSTEKYWKKRNLALFLPGVENPFLFSKYSYTKYFAGIYEKYLFRQMKNAQIVFARADDDAIEKMCLRSKGVMNPKHIVSFPTRIDTDIFYRTLNKVDFKTKLGIPAEETVIACSGRLHWGKGWKLLIGSFVLFLEIIPEAKLYFLGDGSEKDIITSYIKKHSLEGKVVLKGNLGQIQLGDFLRASDMFVMGSYTEGWSTSLVEAVSCGIPACVTDFSSATALVTDGFNGYVCTKRDKKQFADLMLKCLEIPDENLQESAENAKKYSIHRIKEEMLKYWDIAY